MHYYLFAAACFDYYSNNEGAAVEEVYLHSFDADRTTGWRSEMSYRAAALIWCCCCCFRRASVVSASADFRYSSDEKLRCAEIDEDYC
jgi:hypothetical protein